MDTEGDAGVTGTAPTGAGASDGDGGPGHSLRAGASPPQSTRAAMPATEEGTTVARKRRRDSGDSSDSEAARHRGPATWRKDPDWSMIVADHPGPGWWDRTGELAWETYEPSRIFEGARRGRVYTTTKWGTGYYMDTWPAGPDWRRHLDRERIRPLFRPSAVFEGRWQGYVFTTTACGTGYYLDVAGPLHGDTGAAPEAIFPAWHYALTLMIALRS